MKPFEYTPSFEYLENAPASECETATGPVADDSAADVLEVLRALVARKAGGR